MEYFFSKNLMRSQKQLLFFIKTTADISGFRNLEYWNNESRVIRFFYFQFFFNFYDHLNYSNTQNTYMIIYHKILNLWNFDSFRNRQILKIF